jgi:hypothetical protein
LAPAVQVAVEFPVAVPPAGAEHWEMGPVGVFRELSASLGTLCEHKVVVPTPPAGFSTGNQREWKRSPPSIWVHGSLLNLPTGSRPAGPQGELDCRIGATRAGNPRPATRVPTSELKMLLGQHPVAQHVARAGSQQVLGEHLLGKGRRVLPGAGLEPRIQRGKLRQKPRLSHVWLLAHRSPEDFSGPPPALRCETRNLIREHQGDAIRLHWDAAQNTFQGLGRLFRCVPNLSLRPAPRPKM